MADQSLEFAGDATLENHPQIALINTFCEITACASKSEAQFFLESHNFDVDAAVSTYLDDNIPAEPLAAGPASPLVQSNTLSSPSESLSPPPSRSRSPSPPPSSRPYSLRSAGKRSTGASDSGGARRGGGGGGIRTMADLNKNPKNEDSDSDTDFDPQEYYTGGEKSGMLVRGPPRATDADAIFNQARQSGAVDASANQKPTSSSRSFTGTGRLLSGEASSTPDTPEPPQAVNHNISFWRNGFTVDDGPLRRFDDPTNASFLESIAKGECPRELASADKRAPVHVNLTRKEEDYKEPERKSRPFRGVGRTLGSNTEAAPMETSKAPAVLTAAPTPSPGLVVNAAQPSTSIQLRLADGTRMVSRFNNHHTIRDIRSFIDASRPDGPRTYQLQNMGFPPKQLTDLDQTIDDAGIANSVVIQKL